MSNNKPQFQAARRVGNVQQVAAELQTKMAAQKLVQQEIEKLGEKTLGAFNVFATKTWGDQIKFSSGTNMDVKIKLTRELISAMYNAGIIQYRTELEEGKEMNIFELYFGPMKSNEWYENYSGAIKHGQEIDFLTVTKDGNNICGDIQEAFLFYFCQELHKKVKENNAEINTLEFEGKVPIYAIMDYLKRIKPNLIVTDFKGTQYGAIFENVAITKSWMGPNLTVNVKNLAYSRNGFTQVKTALTIPIKSFLFSASELNFREITEEKMEELTIRGKRYVEYNSKASYLNYSGVGLRKSWMGPRQYNCRGRVMVDFASMVSSDPDYSYYFGSNRYADEESGEKISAEDIKDDILFSAAPYLYGYSMAAKQWVEMDIDDLSDIQFSDSAFDELVLDNGVKDIIMSLVCADKTEFKDIIQSKGLGYIFLLSGGPGTGKTLTAEALAETLHRPIYYVTVGELSTDVDSLEDRLKKVLDIAETWNAILLIDEIDIFVQRRGKDADIERNAMTGVFLRLLEYYSGIMFLTTNLVDSLDPAFLSRVSLSISYGHHLTKEARELIWRNLTKKVEIQNVDYKLLSQFDINGRRIKNCIRLLMTLSSFKAVKPTMSQLVEIIELSKNESESSGYGHQAKTGE